MEAVYMITDDDLPNTSFVLQKYDSRRGRRVPLLPVYEEYRCAGCGKIDEYAALRQGISERVRIRSSLDIGCSAEGLTVVSGRFCNIVAENRIIGVDFLPIPSSPDHFVMLPNLVARTDEKCCAKTGMEFLNRCHQCGRYEETASGWPMAACMELPSNSRSMFTSSVRCEGKLGVSDTFYTYEPVRQILLSANLTGLDTFIKV